MRRWLEKGGEETRYVGGGLQHGSMKMVVSNASRIQVPLSRIDSRSLKVREVYYGTEEGRVAREEMNDGRSESGGWKIGAAAIEAKHEARLWSLERRLNPTLTHSPLEPRPPIASSLPPHHHHPTQNGSSINIHPPHPAGPGPPARLHHPPHGSTNTTTPRRRQGAHLTTTITITKPRIPIPGTASNPPRLGILIPPGPPPPARQQEPRRRVPAVGRPWRADAGDFCNDAWGLVEGGRSFFLLSVLSQHGLLADVDKSRWRGSGGRRGGGWMMGCLGRRLGGSREVC